MSMSNLGLSDLMRLGLKEIFDNINNKFELYEKELNKLKSEVSDLENKIDELKQENNYLKNYTFADLENKFDDLKYENNYLKNEIDELKLNY